MSHLTTAASSGMKAGLKVYMAQLQRSGLPQVQAKLDEYNSLRKKQRLAHYCNEFGSRVTAEQGTFKNKPRNARVVGVKVFADEGVPASLSSEIEQARARLAELEAAAAKPAPKPKAKAAKQDKATKPNVWHGWAVRKHGIPTTVGAEFTYKGKRRTSTFKVTSVSKDGSVESIRVK